MVFWVVAVVFWVAVVRATVVDVGCGLIGGCFGLWQKVVGEVY